MAKSGRLWVYPNIHIHYVGCKITSQGLVAVQSFDRFRRTFNRSYGIL